MNQPPDVVRKARTLASSGASDSSCTRLSGGFSHDVFAASVHGRSAVVKVYRSDQGTADREWAALRALAGTGVAPDPISFHPHETQPVVVMSHLAGRPVDGDDISEAHADAIARAHFAVHRSTSSYAQPSLKYPSGMLERVRSLFAAWAPDAPGSKQLTVAREHAEAWLASPSAELVALIPRTVLCHGDGNLTNYLWSGETLQMVDWEHSGLGDPAFELADMAEHAATRTVQEGIWDRLVDAFTLDAAARQRYSEGRRLMACFWLALLESRTRAGLPLFQVSLETQAERVIRSLA